MSDSDEFPKVHVEVGIWDSIPSYDVYVALGRHERGVWDWPANVALLKGRYRTFDEALAVARDLKFLYQLGNNIQPDEAGRFYV